eukprot:766618-Hanusia_phi.AAC.12
MPHQGRGPIPMDILALKLDGPFAPGDPRGAHFTSLLIPKVCRKNAKLEPPVGAREDTADIGFV